MGSSVGNSIALALGNPIAGSFKKGKDLLENTGGGNDLINSITEDPARFLLAAGNTATSAIEAPLILAKRARQDQKDQAEGRADKQIQQAQIAEANARDVAVKEMDPMALARRARAQLAGANGRSSTILTNNQLGTGDVYQKQLLGL